MKGMPIGDHHTPEELQTMLERMSKLTEHFYWPAMQIGCHGFIEFCGLMNEYIAVCRSTMAKGIDFTASNTHSENALVMESYQVAYFAEKFDCIFGPSLRANPSSRVIIEEALGLELAVPAPQEQARAAPPRPAARRLRDQAAPLGGSSRARRLGAHLRHRSGDDRRHGGLDSME